MTATGPPLLNACDISVTRGGMRILDAMSFEVRPGSVVVLRGPNGVGKTSLLRTLSGLAKPGSGEVTGSDATVFVGHKNAVKPVLSVVENLSFFAEVYGQKEVQSAIAAFGLQALMDRPGGELSAGQTRRLGLARAIVSKRPVWALDEPTVGLDGASLAAFIAVAKTHCAAGGALILATHVEIDLPVAQTLDLDQFRAKIETSATDGAFL